MLDLVVRGARLVDGTGAPSTMGSVGVTDGKIVHVGPDSGLAAKREVSAEGRVLAPGFIDPHTHYDVQLCWDKFVTSSSWHGVTTVLMGNCGVGIAPSSPSTRESALRDLENVEGLPYEIMQAGVPWEWERYGEYLDFLDRRGLAINVAGLVPLSPLRHRVIGDASVEREATPDERVRLVAEFRDAVEGGAFGFSTDLLPHHVGYKGRPLACRKAGREELGALCNVLRELDRGLITLSVASLRRGTAVINDEELDLLRFLTTESGRRVSWLPLLVAEKEPDKPRQSLARLGDLVHRAVPQVSANPLVFLVNLQKPFRFGFFETWRAALNATPAEQKQLYASEQFRTAAATEMATHQMQIRWDLFRVISVKKPDLSRHVGRTIAEIAAEVGRPPLLVMLDMALEDDLATVFQQLVSNFDDEAVAWLLQKPELLIGLSDGGAHLDQLCDSSYATTVLSKWVRQKKVLTLEEAVRRMTSMPADVIGMRDRGRLVPGLAADLVLFDPDKAAPEPPRMVHDLPLGGARLVARSNGIAATFVGGVQVIADGELTGELPGRALRSATSSAPR